MGACFARVAARFPAKTAMSCEGRHVSFSELDLASDAIARRLLAGKPRPPGRIALLFDDRMAAIEAMLGVLKAGDAYVPLDAADPDERMRLILGDCEPLALMTDNAHVGQASALLPQGCRLVNIDTPALNDGTSQRLPEVDPDALAYLFYTSGSTGQPKGVCQSHRNLLHFVGCYCETLGIGGEDRLSLLYSLSFSAANMDIYGSLLNGATLHAFDMRRNGIPRLAEWLEREGITVLHTVPTVFRHLAGSLDPAHRFERIRAVDLGGETVFTSDVAAFRRHFPNQCRLVNHLAATEASVMAQHVVDPAEPCEEGLMLPVGRSPKGVRLHVQRPDGTAANAGEVGEIIVSSRFVSPGYWRRPELNAAAFHDDAENPGWRVYRTGDLGRLSEDGNLHFLGRTGTRIKIRGQSVDLAEVEAGLRQCSCVRDATVVADIQEDGKEADRLVAYVVAGSKSGRDPKMIRRELADRLPLYMLPSAYVFLDALSLTATGKIDKKALPRLSRLPGATQEDFQPPIDDLEKQIAAAFQKVLKYSPVGRTDDFFLMGGDSMSVVELKILLTDLVGNHVPDVFEDASVAGVADSIRHLLSRISTNDDGLMPVLVPLMESGTDPALYLVHGRLGQAHVSSYFLELTGRDQPLYAFQARGVDGIQTPNRTIGAMAQDYVAALLEKQPRGPYFLGGFCAGSYVAIEMARLLCQQRRRLFPLLLIDPPAPFFSDEMAAKFIRAIDARLNYHLKEGKIEIDFKDPRRRKGAAEVAEAFEKALLEYRPKPYGGPVLLLTSRNRLSPEEWGNPDTFKAVFSGRVDRFTVGRTHGDILDVHNERFARGLVHCIRMVRSAAKAN